MNYKNEVLGLLRKYKVQAEAADIFYELFNQNALARFGMSNKDIDNFCAIKNIILNSENCFDSRLREIPEDYVKDLIDKSSDLLCKFEKEFLYEFILKALETGFRLANEERAIYDFYRVQNILSIYIIESIRKYSYEFDIFELTASFVKFSNFISELVSLAYYEKILTLKVSEMYEKSLKDPLTGLYNRNKFNEIETAEFSRSKRYKIPTALCLMDIDNFKAINDTYGHIIGDKILKTVGDLILQNIRKSDIAIRWGGEEFLILFTHTPLENAKVACKKLIEKIRYTEVKEENKTIKFSVSMGLTELKDGDEHLKKAIERADQALYNAKRSGKNRIEILT